MPRSPLFVFLASLGALTGSPANALDGQREDVTSFVTEMNDRHGFDAAALVQVFAQVQSRPSIIEAMSRPAEKTMAWHEYRTRFITERRVQRGAKVGQDQAEALQKGCGHRRSALLLAITGVETFNANRQASPTPSPRFDYPRAARSSAANSSNFW
jgi:membrane-bound lytic murein transglycosylase B